MFVRQFDRWIKWSLVGLTFGTVVLIGGIVAWAVLSEAEPPKSVIWGGLFAILAVYMGFWWRAWNAPARSLAGRSAVGCALTREEVRRGALKQMSWGYIAAIAASALIAVVRVDWSEPLTTGSNLLWLLMAALVLLAAAFVAVRKWRSDRD